MEILLIGMVGGVLSGLLGIGSGSLFVPALVFFAGLGQQAAQGVSLAVIVPTSLLGGIFYYRKQLFSKDGFLLIMLGGILGAVLGSLLANQLDQILLRKIFATVLLATGVKILRS
jgi:uncharacterized membrane protein YfcA